MTPEAVAQYQKLDRAIGKVCGFLGVAKSDMGDADQASLDKALSDIDDASTWLQKWIYDQCGVK